MEAPFATDSPAKTPVDLANCAREPIHIPGSVQPHGLLLALREPDWLIEHASLNSRELLGIEAAQLAGQPLSHLLDSVNLQLLEELRPEVARPGHPVFLSLTVHAGRGQVRCEGGLHRSGDRLLLELVPQTGRGRSRTSLPFERARRSAVRLEQAGSLAELWSVMAREMQRLTGFDRVMVYRFDHQGDGEVVAEERAEGMENWLGHRYPASDIPDQARALYRLNPVRLIADVAYRPAPLVPGLDAAGRPLDLTYSFLRSVSPVHIEYLKNMGVAASLSISVLRDGQLWGLVACHHRAARYVSYEVLSAGNFLGKIMAARLAALEEREGSEYHLRLKDRLVELQAAMVGPAGPVPALAVEPGLDGFVAAGGTALRLDGEWRLAGRTPSPHDLNLLAEWLRHHAPGPVFATDRLPLLYPPAAEFKDCASGLLAAAIYPAKGEYLLWFRPEALQTVRWAGDPRQPVEAGQSPDGLRLHPRRSFAIWEEQVRLTARPWQPYEVQAAAGLREATLAAALSRSEKTVNELLAVSRLAAGLGHDFNNLLASILMTAELALVKSGPQSELRRPLERVIDNVNRAAELVRRLLEYAGKAVVRPARTGLDRLAGEQVEIRRVGAPPGVRLEFEAAANLPPVEADPALLRQALDNLLENAVEALGERGGVVRVSLGHQRVGPDAGLEVEDGLRPGRPVAPGEYVYLEVADDGEGIEPAALGRIFEPFYTTRFIGRGMGLASVAGIVRAHHGAVQVSSRPGAGSRFRLLLPL